MKKQITTTAGGRAADKIKEFTQKLSVAAMTAMSGMSSTASATLAKAVMKGVISIIVDIFPLFGAVFVLLGVFTLFMAIKTDQPEKKNTGIIMDIAIDAIMIVFKAFVWNRIKGIL